MWEWALFAAAGLLAGFLDSIVGGGGVITLPTLLASGMPAHTAVATNKVAGTGASSIASLNYIRAGLVERRLAFVGFPLAALAGATGAAVVLRLPATFVTVAVAILIVAITAYVLLRPRFGTVDRYAGPSTSALVAVAIIALAVGFYDGVLGPGTGNLLLFALVAWLGMSFRPAAANGRVLNFGSNLGALVFFIAAGPIDWAAGLAMAAGTMTGGYIGSRFGVEHGERWVRPLFVAVAGLLLVRLLWSLRP